MALVGIAAFAESHGHVLLTRDARQHHDGTFVPCRHCRITDEVDQPKGQIMDKDRIKGSAQQLKGKIKEAVGKASGDAKLESEGKADKAAGKVQNAVGGLKDALRGK